MSIPEGSTVVLRAVVGSTVHGTNISDQADLDEMAIAIEPMRYVIGLQHWESSIIRTQPDGVRSQPGDTDLTIHSLRKFCRLSIKGNPSLLICLFVPDDALIEINPLGRELRQKRDMFLSKDAGGTFLGYMHAQRSRMTGESGSRHGAPRPELIEKYGFDTKYAGHIVRLGLQGIELMETGVMSLPMQRAHREEVIAVRTGQVPFNDVVTRAGILERDLRDAVDGSFLPQHANREAIDSFLSEAYCRAWGALWHRTEQSAWESEHNKVMDKGVIDVRSI